jgi:hypothetical protein
VVRVRSSLSENCRCHFLVCGIFCGIGESIPRILRQSKQSTVARNCRLQRKHEPPDPVLPNVGPIAVRPVPVG